MKVLVAVDDKPSSQAIIDALVKTQWSDGTEIHVITVVAPGKSEVSIECIEDLAVELHQALKFCQVFFHASKGDPKTTILNTAKQIGADLIVIGSNCKNTLERLLIGSVSQAVLNGAHCPVVVAKRPCCLAQEASPGFRNILVPIDDSVYTDIAITWLVNFRWSPECRFVLAAVVEEDTNIALVKQSLQERAQKLSKFLKTKNVFVEIADGSPKDAIIELANKYYSDLIVIGSHGRTGLKKLLLGNVAQSITHEAPCAVAVVRGLAPDDQAWVDTGAFEKAQPVPIEKLVPAYSKRRENDVMPGVMPGGMGLR